MGKLRFGESQDLPKVTVGDDQPWELSAQGWAF